ncbi:MAG TPA: tetratricopeptide repeat protein [Flavobacterium sp.]|nr:tetratricopeptide repeat protein [Flavobacterium sp.]
MFKISKAAALIFVLLIYLNSYAQDKTVDSLKMVLQNPKLHDTTKLVALASEVALYNQDDPKFIYLNDLMGKLALKNYRGNQSAVLQKRFAMFLGAYYNNLGNEYSNKRDVVKALAFYDKSIVFFKYAEAYNEMNYVLVGKGAFLSKINEYEKAISSMFAALRFYEKEPAEYADGIVYVQSSLATIYSDQGRHEESIAYNKKVIDYFDRKTELTAEDENRKASAYANCGTSYFEMSNYAEARIHFNKSLSLFKKIKHGLFVSIVLSKLARVEMKESKYDAAEALLREALAGDIPELAVANANVKLGELFYMKKEFAKADRYLTDGLALSRKVKNLELQTQASELLFKVSKANNNFEKALEMHEFHDQLADSSKTETAKNILAQQQLKYNFEKKELNYKLTNEKANAAKNNMLILLSAALLLILLGGYFYYRNSKQKQAINLLEKDQIKQKLLITQMNPHFIFNSIENIQGLIDDKQNDAAVNYLNKFSILTRQILENSNENYISLTEEIEMTKNYLAIQQLLYNNKFDFDITVEESIDSDTIFLPPMLTQPFIENAIKHGLSNTTEHGLVHIGFYLKESKLFFEVSDNGKGFDAHKKANGHKSLAMTITKERLVYYTKNLNFVVQTDNILGADNTITGAKVVFEIPYIYEN